MLRGGERGFFLSSDDAVLSKSCTYHILSNQASSKPNHLQANILPSLPFPSSLDEIRFDLHTTSKPYFTARHSTICLYRTSIRLKSCFPPPTNYYYNYPNPTRHTRAPSLPNYTARPRGFLSVYERCPDTVPLPNKSLSLSPFYFFIFFRFLR